MRAQRIIRNKIRLLTALTASLGCLALAPTTSQAQGTPQIVYKFNVSVSGSDSENNCQSAQTPCRTIAYTCAQVPIGSVAVIRVADGTYEPDNCDISHLRSVYVIGNEADRTQVVVRNTTGKLFWAQDFAVIQMSGLTLGTSNGGSGVIGVATRQFAIIDPVHIDFDNLAVGMLANEISKINPGAGVRVTGNQSALMQANQGASIEARVPITFVNNPTVDVIYWISGGAKIFADGASFSGSVNAAHKYMVMDHGTLWLPTRGDPNSVPGNSVVVQAGGTIF